MQKIKAGIIGAAGYTGGELIRLLLRHPSVSLVFAQSKSNAGNPVGKVHEDLHGDTELLFSAEHHFDIDILFFCAGHGEAKTFLEKNDIPLHVKLIDLGNDFRLAADASFKGRKFIYGLPEINKEKIQKADSIANPGCFATAIQLSLLPLAKKGWLKEAFVTGITGSTGAGQSLSQTSHFSWRANNIQAYKTLSHQHVAEIEASLMQLQDTKATVNFVPWRGDFTRGIFVSSQVSISQSSEEVNKAYDEFYADDLFVKISNQPIHLKQVINTNKAMISIEQSGNMLVVHAVIDNLLKGASGQAVQNMNLMFGLEEGAGLDLKGTAF